MKSKKKIVFIGAPGSGKGTAASIISKDYELNHISTGSLFRQKIEHDTDELSQTISQLMNSGQLIPDEITNELAKNEILKCIGNDVGFILDGYPRNVNQATFLNDVCSIDHIIYFDVNEEILLKRITGRLSCAKCNKIYNIYFNPPKQTGICDNCLEILFQRKDDNIDSVKHRMEEYRTKTTPVINFFKNLNKLDKINAGKPVEDVVAQIKKVLDAN